MSPDNTTHAMKLICSQTIGTRIHGKVREMMGRVAGVSAVWILHRHVKPEMMSLH